MCRTQHTSACLFTETQRLHETTGHVLENIAVELWWPHPDSERRQIFQTELPFRKQSNPMAMTFWISAGDVLPRSAVWCLDVQDLAGPRASGNVRRAQMLRLCYCGASLCWVLLPWLEGGWLCLARLLFVEDLERK